MEKLVWVPVISFCKKERGPETQFTTKIGGKKLVWVPVISFCKTSFLVTHLMAYYAEIGDSRPLIARLSGNFTFYFYHENRTLLKCENRSGFQIGCQMRTWGFTERFSLFSPILTTVLIADSHYPTENRRRFPAGE
jgi:hypothetical protein